MTKIALPVSEYFRQVEPQLFPFIGAISIRNEKYLDKEFKIKDILYHANGFIDDDFDKLVNNRRFLEKLNSYADLLSFDLGPSCKKVDYSTEGYIGKSPVLAEDQILGIADKKINNIRKYFKGTISAENLDYHPSGAYEIVCRPEFICRFVKKFNICLTLDIGHLEVTCNNLSIDAYDYLEKLPLSSIAEIHLTHSQGAQDLHMLPTEREYKLLDFILGRIPAPYVVIEYHYDPEGIIYGNKQLYNFLRAGGYMKIKEE